MTRKRRRRGGGGGGGGGGRGGGEGRGGQERRRRTEEEEEDRRGGEGQERRDRRRRGGLLRGTSVAPAPVVHESASSVPLSKTASNAPSANRSAVQSPTYAPRAGRRRARSSRGGDHFAVARGRRRRVCRSRVTHSQRIDSSLSISRSFSPSLATSLHLSPSSPSCTSLAIIAVLHISRHHRRLARADARAGDDEGGGRRGSLSPPERQRPCARRAGAPARASECASEQAGVGGERVRECGRRAFRRDRALNSRRVVAARPRGANSAACIRSACLRALPLLFRDGFDRRLFRSPLLCLLLALVLPPLRLLRLSNVVLLLLVLVLPHPSLRSPRSGRRTMHFNKSSSSV